MIAIVEVTKYCRNKGFTGRINGNEYVFDKCPFCDKPKKATMNTTTGLFFCQRVSCQSKSISPTGKGMNFYQFQKHYGDTPEYPSNNYFMTARSDTAVIPKDIVGTLTTVNRDWLNMRCLSDEIIDSYKVGQRRENEIAFPYYDNDQVVYIKYRIRNPKEGEPKCTSSAGSEGGFFGKQHVSFDHDCLYICEGEIDCMSLARYGIQNVVSVPNGASSLKWIEREWIFIHQFKMIYLCFDNDKAGQAPIEDIAKRLSDHICKRVIFPFKDVNECLMNDVLPEDMIKSIDASESVFKAGYTDGGEDFDEAVSNYKNPDITKGISTGIPFLDECIKGWRPREITIIGGHGGVGKTTLMLQLIRNFAKHKEISTLLSLEMEWMDLIEWVFEQNGLTAHSPDEDFERIRKNLQQWVRVVKSSKKNDEEYILSMMELSARIDGVRFFMLDNLTMMDMGQDDFDRIKQFIINCIKFVRKYNAHLIILTHSRKAGNGKGDDARPTIDSIMGSGNITRLAQNVILMYNKKVKNIGERRETILEVVKHRKHGQLGKAGFAMENRKTFKQISDGTDDEMQKDYGD